MSHLEPITVCISRKVKPGHEAAYERALHDFVQRTLKTMPGQLGVHIMRPIPGSDSREYGIIRKFANRHALEDFRTSAEYLEWNFIAKDMTEGSSRVEELSGLESWFTPLGSPLRPLPKWKMALLTLLGVYLTSLFLNATVGPWIKSCPPFIGLFISAALFVSLLTWLVMPIISHLFRKWLYPEEKEEG